VTRVLTLAAVVFLAGCGGGDDRDAAPQPIATQAAVVAPEISGTTLDGETISLGDFRGRPVVVNVWSSW
jgi:cytochrome oxidase Cu insertion factor (SCO1/SenC/PrrC family)